MVMVVESKQSAPVRNRRSVPHRASTASGQEECSADFDRYLIVYSDHMDHDDAQLPRLAPITSLMLGQDTRSPEHECSLIGETTIGCYQGNRFVGSINFYSNPERHPESSVDPEGLIHLWFALPCFPHILSILHRERNLSLSWIGTDLDGKVFSPPMGALITWPEPTGREALEGC